MARWSRPLYWASVSLVFGYLTWLTVLLYVGWQENGFTKFFLPPYRDISYFTLYSLTRIFAYYLVSFLVSLLFLWAAQKINKRSGGAYFEKEEPYLGALTVFLVGSPGWLYYLLLLLGAYLGWHVISWLRGIKEIRLPLYHLWTNLGIVTILLIYFWFSKTQLWLLLKI